jgi:phosphoglucosamine mutase
MQKLFGTDGIRGVAGEFPLDETTVQIIGATLARRFKEKLGRPAKFVTGRDTRESGPSIERALHSGASAKGAECESAGVITTPGVAFLTREFGFDAGIVVSASHNPFNDNGIKVFLPSGKKLDEADERLIEQDISQNLVAPSHSAPSNAHATRADELHAAYLEHFLTKFPHLSLKGKKIVVDCANGASYTFAPKILSRLGATVVSINESPDGTNINLNCGSLHLEGLQSKVLSHSADFGVAYDGDADRALFVDECGEVVDGDATLWILASHLQEQGNLTDSKVIATVMSNIGLELALEGRNVKLIRTAVGDKYVLDELLKTGAALGGEQSGHIIVPDEGLVGDGIMTTLLVLEVLAEKNVPFSELKRGFKRYPQTLVNIKVREKRPFDDVPEIADTARQIESELDGSGRLLLRYSGTENLARVMIEGREQSEINEQANRLAGVIEAALG